MRRRRRRRRRRGRAREGPALRALISRRGGRVGAPRERPLATSAFLQDPPRGGGPEGCPSGTGHTPGVAIPLPPSPALGPPPRPLLTPASHPAPTLGSVRVRPPEFRCPLHPSAARSLGDRAALQGPGQPESEAVAACPSSGLGAQAPGAAPNDPNRGETRPRCPQRPPCPVPEAPREGRARARAGARQSGRSGQRVKWVPECAEESGNTSTLASPPWGIVPPPPVMAAGGDDVLHFVGTAVGTWDQFKTKPRGAGKLGPAKPQLGSAIRPRGQPLVPASAPEGPLGDGRHGGETQTPLPASINQDGGSCGLPWSWAPACWRGWSLPSVCPSALPSFSSAASFACPPPASTQLLHCLPPSPGPQRLRETPLHSLLNRFAQPGPARLRGAERRCGVLRRAPGRACRGKPHRRWGFSFVRRLHLRLRRTSWCCAISKIPRKEESEASFVSP